MTSIDARLRRQEVQQAHREATAVAALTKETAMPTPAEDARTLAHVVLSEWASTRDIPYALLHVDTPDEETAGDVARRILAAEPAPVDITRATIRFRCTRHDAALVPATSSYPEREVWVVRSGDGHAHGPGSFTLNLVEAFFCPEQFYGVDQAPAGPGGNGTACSADWTVTAEPGAER